jgi:hypothetical protein
MFLKLELAPVRRKGKFNLKRRKKFFRRTLKTALRRFSTKNPQSAQTF